MVQGTSIEHCLALKDSTGEEIVLRLEWNQRCIVHMRLRTVDLSMRNDEMIKLENLMRLVHKKVIINKCWPNVVWCGDGFFPCAIYCRASQLTLSMLTRATDSG